MSLWVVREQLWERGIEAAVAAYYAWRLEATKEPRSDSLGLFAIGGTMGISRALPDKALTDKDEEVELPTFELGQGFPVPSFLGGDKAVERSLAEEPPAVAGGKGSSRDYRGGGKAKGGGQQPPLPPCLQKLADGKKWDPHGELFPRGGHMPLMVWVGFEGRRSPEARARRRAKAEKKYRERHPEEGKGGKGGKSDQDRGGGWWWW